MKGLGILVLLAATVLSAGVTRADGDSFAFSTDPSSGAVSGAAGTTVGWGYSITNASSSDWLVIIDVNTTSDFSNGTADSSIFDFPIIAPGQTDSQVFSNSDGTGLYELAWNSSAPVGASNSGQFDVTGLFCNDASLDVCSGTTLDEFASYQAIVTATPEPPSTLLLAAGIMIVLLGRAVVGISRTN